VDYLLGRLTLWFVMMRSLDASESSHSMGDHGHSDHGHGDHKETHGGALSLIVPGVLRATDALFLPGHDDHGHGHSGHGHAAGGSGGSEKQSLLKSKSKQGKNEYQSLGEHH
jgi:hypothetical protein